MAQYGTTKEQLAEIAVQTRQWAAMNPKALMHDPITVDDVLNSRMISYPFNILDCCLVTDAGGAVVVVGPERARDLPKKPVWVLGMGEAHDHQMISQMPDLTRTAALDLGAEGPGHGRGGYRRHRPGHDLRLVHLHGAGHPGVAGVLQAGRGRRVRHGGRLGPGGSLPTNTNGGGLSYTHPGMYGMFLLLEATRQLRGECGQRQVDNCQVALVNGTGGFLSSTGTLILGAD